MTRLPKHNPFRHLGKRPACPEKRENRAGGYGPSKAPSRYPSPGSRLTVTDSAPVLSTMPEKADAVGATRPNVYEAKRDCAASAIPGRTDPGLRRRSSRLDHGLPRRASATRRAL